MTLENQNNTEYLHTRYYLVSQQIAEQFVDSCHDCGPISFQSLKKGF